jgi:hypothetical protein
MAATLPPTLWWVAQRSMRFLATLALAAIVLTTGTVAQATDAQPAADKPAASTAAHEPVASAVAPEPVALCAAGEPVFRPSLRLSGGRQHAEAERGAGGMEIKLAGPAVHIGDPIGRAGPAKAVWPARLSGKLSGQALGQRAPPRP